MRVAASGAVARRAHCGALQSATGESATAAAELDAALVQRVYNEELGGGERDLPHQRVMLLEISSYLERYLWPHFDEGESTMEHVMSVVLVRVPRPRTRPRVRPHTR